MIVRYSAVYNADGGVWGETRYVIGHVLGLTKCSLCDITHSPIRRKPDWDLMISRLGVPIRLLHRNELDAALTTATGNTTLPAVFAHYDDGSIVEVLSAAQLDELDGSISAFESALRRSTL